MILLAAASNIGSGAAATYGGLITGRVFCGIGASLPLGLGAATVFHTTIQPSADIN